MRHFVSLVSPRGDGTVYRPSVCLSVTFWYPDHIGWNTSKMISPSNKIVLWQFLRNRRLIFALTYNFRGTHILGASRGHLCDSVISFLVNGTTTQYDQPLASSCRLFVFNVAHCGLVVLGLVYRTKSCTNVILLTGKFLFVRSNTVVVGCAV